MNSVLLVTDPAAFAEGTHYLIFLQIDGIIRCIGPDTLKELTRTFQVELAHMLAEKLRGLLIQNEVPKVKTILLYLISFFYYFFLFFAIAVALLTKQKPIPSPQDEKITSSCDRSRYQQYKNGCVR